MPASYGGASISRLLGCNVFHVINPQYNYTTTQLQDLNNYVGRMNTVLDEVTECGDIAVFYPIATVQALHNADSDHSSTTGGQKPTEVFAPCGFGDYAAFFRAFKQFYGVSPRDYVQSLDK